MDQAVPDMTETSFRIAPVPSWAAGRTDTPVAAAFASGAALCHLEGATSAGGVPLPLWRARLALAAAGNCARLSGRREGVAALRDALHLARAGDSAGPAGEILRLWTAAVGRPLASNHLAQLVPEALAALRPEGQGLTPVDQAAQVLQSALTAAPRAETAALILADAALARALRWDHAVPLLAPTLGPRDLALRDAALALACHRAAAAGAAQAVALAGDLGRRAARLRAAAPKLRSKAAARAVALFLSRDALAPAALAGLMSDRAARRLCDRLVELGAIRELTGRDSFRLYGL
jgi:hypothetical protein